jgi:hypothetical protein
MVDGGNLQTQCVAADIDDGEMVGHRGFITYPFARFHAVCYEQIKFA